MIPRFTRRARAASARLLPILLSAFVSIASATPVIVAPDLGQLQQILDNAVENGVVEGVVASAAPVQGPAWLGVSGLSDTANQTPMTAGLQFRVGSITKTFVATLILQMVDAGKLTLDDTVDQWIPELHIPDGTLITIRQLLNMTAGVPNYLGAEVKSGGTTEPFIDVFFQEPLEVWPATELAELSTTLPRPFAPGAGWEYSNSNYVLLGLIAEKVNCPGGTPDCPTLATLVNRSLSGINHNLDQAGMPQLKLTHTLFPQNPNFPAVHSNGYAGIEDGAAAPSPTVKDFTLSSPSAAWAAGAVISTAGDLANWLHLIIENPDQVLYSNAMQQARMTFVDGSLEGFPVQYGLGIMNASLIPDVKSLGHGGEIFGYSVMMYRTTPSTPGGTEYYMVVATNRFLGKNDLTQDPGLALLIQLESVLYGTTDVPTLLAGKRKLGNAPALFFK
ncbi:serine hydrolase domain-containing protein [Endothiovibrio diazotrophicus]